MQRYDTVVLGLGAMGSAALLQLAKRGQHVAGIDRFSPPHAFGSSHGDSRVTRLAIGEGAHYTPLVMRSHQLWREIEKETGRDLMTTTGGLIISSRSTTSRMHVQDFFGTTVAAAERYGIAHEILDARAIKHRFPQFNVRDDEIGYYEYEAGFLRPETCVAAQLALAEKHGAAIHRNEKVLGFEDAGSGITVKTDKQTYAAGRLIVSAGAWLPQLIASKYAAPFKIRRQVLFWYAPKGAITPFQLGNFPIYIWELQGRPQAIYGFPAIDGEHGGIKVATQQYETETTPEDVDRTVSGAEARAMYDYIAPYLPGFSGKCLKAVVCLYTVTPDAEFVIDAHPEMPHVIVASPCSGHGFKHSAAIGEALSEIVIDGKSRLDLSPFKFSRLTVRS
jgi:sarcosine oxidase